MNWRPLAWSSNAPVTRSAPLQIATMGPRNQESVSFQNSNLVSNENNLICCFPTVHEILAQEDLLYYKINIGTRNISSIK